MNDIQNILSSRHITKLVYVDDELGKNSYHDNITGKVRVLLEEGKGFQGYPFFDNAEIWEDMFEQWWQEASIADVIQLANSIQVEKSNPDIANKLHEVLPGNFSIELLAPEQFDDSFKKELTKRLSESHEYAIVLIDYDLENYAGNGDSLFESIAGCEYLYCGIFSQTFEINDEIEQWRRRNYNPNVYPLSKKRFGIENSNDVIIQGIKNVIWLKQIESIKNMANTMVATASKTLENGLKEIDPATFDRMIIANSKDEGCWEFDFLSRIIQVYLNRGIKTEMRSMFPDFQKTTNSLRDFHDDTQSENVNKDILESLEKDEAYDDIDYINSVYSAISNGDIFQIGTKYYILLGQPCNLAIRDEGKEEEIGKRNYKLDQAFVVPLIKGENKIFCEKLIYPFKDDFTSVSFPNRQRISLSMLDLVSYNASGEAIIDLNVDSANLPGHEIMQENLLRRYNLIKEKISAIKQQYDLVSDGKTLEQVVQLAKYYCKPFEMGESSVAKKPTIEGSKITFNVKRVGRYNSYGAHVLLQQFMSYMSRPEFPGKINRC